MITQGVCRRSCRISVPDPLFANADLFRQRFAQRAGPPKFIGSELSRDELTARLTLKLSPNPQEIVRGLDDR